MYSNHNLSNVTNDLSSTGDKNAVTSNQEKNQGVKFPNIQDKLKTLAIVSMLIDHTGLFFFPKYEIFRVLGRLAMPIFCFFAGYNFKLKRRSIILKYGLFLALFQYLKLTTIPSFNILISIYLGQIYIQKLLTITNDFISNLFQLLPLILTIPATFMLFDYGTLAIFVMACGFIYKNVARDKKYIFLAVFFSIVYAQILFWFDLHNFVVLIGIAIMCFYCLAHVKNFEQQVDGNYYYTVSRNSIVIYTLNYIIFMLIKTMMYNLNT